MLHVPDRMAGWRLDEVFLAEAMRRAEPAGIVSLDVFDTALTRLVESPVDVFAEIEQRLCATLGDNGAGYAGLRETAEHTVHRGRPRGGEIGLGDIIDAVIAAQPALAPHAALLARTEIEAERALLVAVPDIIELTRRLAAVGKPFMFVSDMYLPAEAIASFLTDAGYSGWQSLHVSSQTGATKSSGLQWQVLREAGIPTGILHIGDDRHADIEMPRACGIDTLLYARARSERRSGVALSPAMLVFSRANRAASLAARNQPDAAPRGTEAFWGDQGRVLGAILVGSFLRWLEARVRRHRIGTLYFCARDGWMLQRAWRAAGLDRATGACDHYLCISRRPLTLACGYLQSRPGSLHPSVVRFLSSSDGTTDFGAALARLGIASVPEILADLDGRGIGLRDRLDWPDGVEAFRALLCRHSALVFARLAESHRQVSAYLAQQGVGEPGAGVEAGCAIVDIGWHGSMQRALRRIVACRRGPTPLAGFYYGLWPPARGNRAAAGMMESAFASDFIAAEAQHEFREAVGIIEELHGAPHGTVVSYRQDGDQWGPVFADHPQEAAQYDTVTRHFQEAVIATVEALFCTGSSGTLGLEDLTPDAARAAVGAISLSPNQEERRRFGSLGHCALFDHAQFDPLVTPDCPDGGQARAKALAASGWPLGTLAAWWEQAGDEDRPAIGRLVADTYTSRPRLLRRFGQ